MVKRILFGSLGDAIDDVVLDHITSAAGRAGARAGVKITEEMTMRQTPTITGIETIAFEWLHPAGSGEGARAIHHANAIRVFTDAGVTGEYVAGGPSTTTPCGTSPICSSAATPSIA